MLLVYNCIYIGLFKYTNHDAILILCCERFRDVNQFPGLQDFFKPVSLSSARVRMEVDIPLGLFIPTEHQN